MGKSELWLTWLVLLVLATFNTAMSYAEESLDWETDYVSAAAKAKDANKPMLVGLYVYYVDTSLEHQDKELLTPAVKAQLSNFVLVKQSLLHNPQWERSSRIWMMPEYLFIDPDGVIIYNHNAKHMSEEAFRTYHASEQERRQLEEAQRASPNDFQANHKLAVWHQERMNRALAADFMKQAALSQPDVKKKIETLLELSEVCVERLSPWSDEATARWALAEIQRLDPEDKYGFKGKVSLREIEIDIEEDRLHEAVKRADEFLRSNPHHPLNGEVLIRKGFALGMLGEFAEAAKVSRLVDSTLVDEETLGQVKKNRADLESLAKWRIKCEHEPADFKSCLSILQDLHDNPPKGLWAMWLRRAYQAKAPSRQEHLEMAFELGSTLLADDSHANKDEAKRYFEEIVNEKNPVDEGLRRRAKEALESR